MRQKFVLITFPFLVTNDNWGIFTPGSLEAFVLEPGTISPLVSVHLCIFIPWSVWILDCSSKSVESPLCSSLPQRCALKSINAQLAVDYPLHKHCKHTRNWTQKNQSRIAWKRWSLIQNNLWSSFLVVRKQSDPMDQVVS